MDCSIIVVLISLCILPQSKVENCKASSFNFESRIVGCSPNSFETETLLMPEIVPSGQQFSATLEPSIPISSLVVSSQTSGVSASIQPENDGNFSVSMQTQGQMGEYEIDFATDDSMQFPSGELKDVSSIYVYSDGTKDYISSISINDARDKCYFDSVATYEDKVLLGVEPEPDNFTPTKTKYQAEKEHLDAIYGTEDINCHYDLGTSTNSGFIQIDGNVVLYDKHGASHPLIALTVGLYSSIAYGPMQTTYLDDNGHFSFMVNRSTMAENISCFYVYLSSATHSTYVANHIRRVYQYQTPSFGFDLYNRFSKITYNVEVHPDRSDRASAFEICHAEEIPYRYIKQLSGVNMPRIDIFYPGWNGETCYYKNLVFTEFISIGRPFHNDWDVLNHEYGHYINNYFGLCDDSVHGKHFVDQDLIHDRGKINGLKLAMSEGLATYLGLASQMLIELDSNISDVGDETYNDDNFYVDLSGYCHDKPGKAGEGNEFSVPGLLLKLLDDVQRPFDNVSLGHQAMWNAIVSKKHWCLSSLVSTILSMNAGIQNDIRVILEKENFAPVPNTDQETHLSTWQGASCWNISWESKGFASAKPNTYKLVFKGEGGANGNEYSIDEIHAGNAVLTESQIDSIFALPGSKIRWRAIGYDQNFEEIDVYSSADRILIEPTAKPLYANVAHNSTIHGNGIEWYKFTAPYSGSFIFKSEGNVDTYGELFPHMVADTSCWHLIQCDDDSGDGDNYEININLSANETVYLRSKGHGIFDSTGYSVMVSSSHDSHVYNYNYEYESRALHKSYCSCGQFIVEPHDLSGPHFDIDGWDYTRCTQCGHLIKLRPTMYPY